MNSTVVFISALQKNFAFQDDLLRRLAGKTLIQRVVEKARLLGVPDSRIHVYTDSEAVALSADRIGVNTYIDSELVKGECGNLNKLFEHIKNSLETADWLLRLSPYAPLLDIDTIFKAQNALIQTGESIAAGKQPVYNRLIGSGATLLTDEFLDQQHEEARIRSGAFTLLRATAVKENVDLSLKVHFISVGEDAYEVRSFQDWWVCEKLLQRKRIVFRVIGSDDVGMGHIYRALSLAHEITDHEVIFVTDTDNQTAVNELTGYDYRLEIFDPCDIVNGILELKPDLLVNDILDTDIEDVVPIQEFGAVVANFEDLGAGANLANVTINELYDEPQYDGKNTFWGSRYFFVRDEFASALPCKFDEQPKALLLAFGGIDQHDLTSKILYTILEICRVEKVHIYVVTGPGYRPYEALAKKIDSIDHVTLTHATGVISKIMEKVSLAITSNGRTVYEMAHMNIPGIVIPQHQREKTHAFAREENGFIAVAPYKETVTQEEVSKLLLQLLTDTKYRRELYNRTKQHRFDENKRCVIDIFDRLLDKSEIAEHRKE